MKKYSFLLLSLIILLFTSCELQDTSSELSGIWEIKSLMANGREFLDNDYVRNYAPDIEKSTVVFGENNTFELSLVYTDTPEVGGPYAEIHKGTYTLNDNAITFNATECTKGGSTIDVCQFRGEVDGNLLRISKSFAAGELKIVSIDMAVAVNVIFKLRE